MNTISASQNSLPRTRRPSFWFGCFLVFGGVFFLVCLLLDLRLALFGTTTDGVVTRVEEKVSSNRTTRRSNETESAYRRRSEQATGGIAFYPWVRYTPALGTPVEFKTLSTFGNEVQPGSAVKVIYLAANPRKAQIHTFKQVWMPIIIGSILTTVTFLLGVFLLRFSGRPFRPL